MLSKTSWCATATSHKLMSNLFTLKFLCGVPWHTTMSFSQGCWQLVVTSIHWWLVCTVCFVNVDDSRLFYIHLRYVEGFPRLLNGKESACQCRRYRFNPESGKSRGEGNGNPVHYSYLGNPMDRGVWQATVDRVIKESDMIQPLNNKHICTL